MTTRPATTADQELLHELWEEFVAELGGPEYMRETWEEAWEDLSETVKDGVALIAEVDDRPVGFVFCILGDRGRKTAHVTDLYVRPEARSQGIGAALLAELLEPARTAGLDHVSLEVLVGNYDARRLYERLGFAPVDVLMAAPLERARRRSRPRRGAAVVRLAARPDGRRPGSRAGDTAVPASGRSHRVDGGERVGQRLGDGDGRSV